MVCLLGEKMGHLLLCFSKHFLILSVSIPAHCHGNPYLPLSAITPWAHTLPFLSLFTFMVGSHHVFFLLSFFFFLLYTIITFQNFDFIFLQVISNCLSTFNLNQWFLHFSCSISNIYPHPPSFFPLIPLLCHIFYFLYFPTLYPSVFIIFSFHHPIVPSSFIDPSSSISFSLIMTSIFLVSSWYWFLSVFLENIFYSLCLNFHWLHHIFTSNFFLFLLLT